MSDRMLVVKVDSTVELPSEPDPGSAGSSSCVSNFSRYMSVRSTFVVLTESSNFNTTTPPGPSTCEELRGSEGETGESMEKKRSRGQGLSGRTRLADKALERGEGSKCCRRPYVLRSSLVITWMYDLTKVLLC